jgi:hypothetical protein
MVRKIAIALAATAAIIAGSALDASARMGGGHGGMGMGHSGMGIGHSGMGMGRGSHFSMGGSSFARMGPGLGRSAIGHPGSFARLGVGHPRFAFRHHRFHNRFFVFAGGYPYYDSCYERVWTRWGWRLVNVCGYY